MAKHHKEHEHKKMHGADAKKEKMGHEMPEHKHAAKKKASAHKAKKHHKK